MNLLFIGCSCFRDLASKIVLGFLGPWENLRPGSCFQLSGGFYHLPTSESIFLFCFLLFDFHKFYYLWKTNMQQSLEFTGIWWVLPKYQSNRLNMTQESVSKFCLIELTDLFCSIWTVSLWILKAVCVSVKVYSFTTHLAFKPFCFHLLGFAIKATSSVSVPHIHSEHSVPTLFLQCSVFKYFLFVLFH